MKSVSDNPSLIHQFLRSHIELPIKAKVLSVSWFDPLDDDAVAFYENLVFILLPDSGKMFPSISDIAQLTL